jgi:predicted ATPase/DNA-binding winged helix-turn-helix (wHTH) protein
MSSILSERPNGSSMHHLMDIKSCEPAFGLSRDDGGVDFGRYRIFPKLRLLLRSGVKVDIGTRAFDVLWVLVQADGEPVSKDQLIDTVWSRVVVEENNLQAQMSAIRRALGADRGMIRTEFGRGYRLVVESQETPRTKAGTSEVKRSFPSRLPLPLTSLLGRAADLREIERLFDKSRLFTITGTGGVGKTRIALELGARLAEHFQDGVHLAEMAKISEDELVGPTLAGALQIPSPDIEHADQIDSILSGRHLLLIVDNCEHLAGPISRNVETILRHGPTTKVLITSQQPLGLDGEQIYRLMPLAVPPADTRDLGTAMAYPAFELFAERSSANVQSLDLDVEVANAICERLDGLPLALELAAARVPTLGVRGVLAALDDRFNLLTAGRRAALSRHRTLRTTVDWSYHLLDNDEQRLFRRLALFASSFDAQAARAVAAPESDDPWFSLDVLGGLVGKSLLFLDLNRTVPRYRFSETIRLYALEKLAESGDVDLSAERHAVHFFEIARRASDDWKKLPTDNWHATYEDAIDDVRAALDWSFSAKGDMRIGVSMLACATPFWIQLSLHGECRRRITHALDRGAETLNPEDEMMLLTALGTALSWATGPVAETSVAWHKALAFARELRANEIELRARYGLWLYNLRSGRYRAALEHAEEMLQFSATDDDSEARAVGRRICGVAQHFLGNHDLARQLIESSLRWFDANRPQQAFRFGLDQRVAGLAYLSRILWVQGFSDQAKEMAATAVVEARALDHANTLCCALADGWCTVHAFEGDYEAVRREAKSLQHIAREHGLGFWLTYGDLFELWAQMCNEVEVPTSRVAAAVASVERLDFDPEYSILFSDILLAAQRKKWDRAALLPISSRLLARHGKDLSWGEPEFLRAGSHLNDCPALALAGLREALSISHRQKAKAWTLKVATDLATILADQGDDDDAKATLLAALDDLPAATGGRDLAAARVLATRLGIERYLSR